MFYLTLQLNLKSIHQDLEFNIILRTIHPDPLAIFDFFRCVLYSRRRLGDRIKNPQGMALYRTILYVPFVIKKLYVFNF